MPEFDSDVLVIGDGPTGLSAALVLAKNDLKVDVLGKDETAMHKAHLYNLLGSDDEPGKEWIHNARRHVIGRGAHIHDQSAAKVATRAGGFRVETEEGNAFRARYLVLATGRDATLADQLGVDKDGEVVRVDLRGRASKPKVYAGGWLTRGHQIQAAISIGDGAAIALDILSTEKGKPFHDFDTAPKGPS